MNNLHLLPRKAALILSMLAFGTALVVGLVRELPPHVMATRAVLGAMAFWAVGLVAGRVFLHAVTEALAEEMTRQTKQTDSSAD
jgi:hypothetical protein